MESTKYENWEKKLKKLQDDFEKELAVVRAAKEEIFAQKSDNLQKLPGKFIRDDERIIISAPEIIIGNVNMGGVLNPDGHGNLIIRDNNIFVEGVGNNGKLAMRAPIISQIAENPGNDGEEHVVTATSQIISQAKEVTIESDNVAENGAFLKPDSTTAGCVSIRADKNISIDALKSMVSLKTKAKAETTAWASDDGKKKFKKDAEDEFKKFEKARKEIDELLKNRDILNDKCEDPLAIRTDYRSIDELNIRIDELSLELAKGLYECSKKYAKLAEGERKDKYYKKLIEGLGNNEENFKKNKTDTSVSINSEQINLTSTDGDGNKRTNPEAGLNVAANSVRFEGIYNEQGELEETNKLAVNMRNVSFTSETKGKPQYKDGQLTSMEYPSTGKFVFRSKDILIESVDYKMVDQKYIEKGLTENGQIMLRSNTIGLSTVKTSDVKVGDDGKITDATYTSDGKVLINTKEVSMKSIDGKIENGTYKDTGLTKESLFSIQAENLAFSATDQEGKAAGTASINAKEVCVRSVDVDPKSQDIKQVAEGGKVEILGKETLTYGSEKAVLYSEKQTFAIGQEEASLHSSKLAEMTQDGNVVRLEGGKVDISGSKNTLFGETTINVLKSPSITVDNLTASKAIKAPNITDGVMVDTKNTSTSSAKSKAEEAKKPEEGAADKAAATAEADRQLAASMLADLWKQRGEQELEDN